MLALVVGAWIHALEQRRWPALRIGLGGLALWFAVIGAPSFARRLYTSQNLVMKELYWELEQVFDRPGPVLVITNKATTPYLLQRVPAVNIGLARTRGPELAWHLAHGTFREVLALQVLRPTSAQGNAVVELDDVLPSNYHLEPLVRKRFGGRWIQVSRVTSVDPEPPAESGQ
jgi:hypothetical protein